MMRDRLTVSIVDVCGHVCFAVLLPGPFWLQVLPDAFLPGLAFWSLKTDRLAPRGATIVHLHRVLHTLMLPIALTAFWLATQRPIYGSAALQWTAHVIWDQFTHPEAEFKKGLLWP